MGSDLIQAHGADGDFEAMKASVMGVVGQHFRPELINRIDEVVVFHALAKDEIKGIATIQLGMLRARLADREMALELDEAVMDKLVENGFDPLFGARPLKRAIQRLIEDPLAQEVLSGRYGPGDTVSLSLDSDGKVVFSG
jgi:ATP-dependent Clp protease ATP-binding subunit ClpB